jgi:hypothetical protein
MHALNVRIIRLGLGVALVSSLGGLACDASLNTSLDRKECTAEAECLPGYVCSEDRVCVKKSASTNAPQVEGDGGTLADAALDPSIPVLTGAAGEGGSTSTPGIPSCDEGTACSGTCAVLSSDPNHCGGCDRRCPGISRGHAVCTDGVCDLLCDEGHTRCGDGCYRVDSDAQHCGSCTFSCPTALNADVSCVEGRCAATCKAGFQDCGGECVRLDTDARHCGACATACTTEQRCAGGACVRACPAGTVECAQSCVDPKTDLQHCGACGQVCPAPVGATAVCTDGACSFQCGMGQTACGAACVDTLKDPLNCGACGQVCTATQSRSHATCDAGACKTACDFGYVACDNYCIGIALLQDQRAFAVCAVLAAAQGGQ